MVSHCSCAFVQQHVSPIYPYMTACPCRNQGASDGVMDGLALFMGHSVKEQRSTYDRRTKAQKVAPAVQLIQGLNMGSEGGSQSSGA